MLSGWMEALCTSTRVCSQGVEKPREQRSETPWLSLSAEPRKGWKERVSPARWFWVAGGYLRELSIIFRDLCAASSTITILLKLQYVSGASSQAAHRMGPELICGH